MLSPHVSHESDTDGSRYQPETRESSQIQRLNQYHKQHRPALRHRRQH
ncbi:hypothetical protein [Leminorella grimontii]|nr:hypothetical protein [Leminorella grimontii]